MIPAGKRGNPAAHGVDGDGCGGVQIKVHDSARPEAVGGTTASAVCYCGMWANFLPATNSNLIMVNQRRDVRNSVGRRGKSVRKCVF